MSGKLQYKIYLFRDETRRIGQSDKALQLMT